VYYNQDADQPSETVEHDGMKLQLHIVCFFLSVSNTPINDVATVRVRDYKGKATLIARFVQEVTSTLLTVRARLTVYLVACA
jgi:hypothetical protein